MATEYVLPYTGSEINRMLGEIADGGGIPIDTAEVGQTIVVKSVDENGKPTEWEAADFPSGGGGAEWKLVANVTIEEDVASVAINTDTDGNAISASKFGELFVRYSLKGTSGVTDRYSALNVWFSNSWAGGCNAEFTGAGNGTSAGEGSIHAIYPKELESTEVARLGHAHHSNGTSKAFKTLGTLTSVNIKTGAGIIPAGSRIIVYGR